MSLKKGSIIHNRNQRFSTESEDKPAKRPRRQNQQRQRRPNIFWDNLSHQWLTSRALRELDRRTIPPTAPRPPYLSSQENIHPGQLKRFARHGGPDLSDLRAYPKSKNPISSIITSSKSSSKKRVRSGDDEFGTSSRTKKSSAYDAAFEQHLIDFGVHLDGYGDFETTRKPNNSEEIHSRLARSRASLSPSCFTNEDFISFRKKNRNAMTETSVMSKTFFIIAGSADIPSQQNLQFSNLKDLTDGSISKAQPGLYNGSSPRDINPQVRKKLGPLIVPSTTTHAPCLPNFFTEGKGPNGSPAVCRNQALYDGVLGARGMHKLRSYVDPEKLFDENAYTITSTYVPSGLLTLYSIHLTPSNDPKLAAEYRMIQLRSFAVTDIPESFRQGAAALRNARDWAKERRDELIAAVNMLDSSTDSFVSLQSKDLDLVDSETSDDELSYDT